MGRCYSPDPLTALSDSLTTREGHTTVPVQRCGNEQRRLTRKNYAVVDTWSAGPARTGGGSSRSSRVSGLRNLARLIESRFCVFRLKRNDDKEGNGRAQRVKPAAA
jgi:hypothetical protein